VTRGPVGLFFFTRARTFVRVVYGEYTLSMDGPRYPNKKVIYYFISLDLVSAYPGTTARFTILFCLYALNYTKTCAYTNTAVLLSISIKYDYYFARCWLKINIIILLLLYALDPSLRHVSFLLPPRQRCAMCAETGRTSARDEKKNYPSSVPPRRWKKKRS